MKKQRHLLITGGTGYIGSHTAVILLQEGIRITILDNLSNSSKETTKRIEELTGKKLEFIEGNIQNKELLDNIFSENEIDAVIHFAGLKSVYESCIDPLNYFDNNVVGTITLLKAMSKANIFNFIFSSSATVYGDIVNSPIVETQITGNTKNPYGHSKYIIEEILKDLYNSNHQWNIGILRYFNPIGAHPSGKIGENSMQKPNNLVPYMMKVAIGKLSILPIFGNDYSTIDGTGMRDYIHVIDLAEGHIAALNQLKKNVGLKIWNLGTGKCHSVLEIISTFEKIIGRTIPYKFMPRRSGDVATCYADTNKAILELKWSAKYDLETMLKDAWRWQKINPNGYE